MKVLWFSNAVLTTSKVKTSGTWFLSLAAILKKYDISVFNITQGNVSHIKVVKYDFFNQWILPKYKTNNKGLPSKKRIEEILNIVESVTPDIIHIWGMELYWGLLQSRGYLKKYKVLLEIQGIKASIPPVFWGGLTLKEKLRCYGLKEILLFTHSLPFFNQNMKRWVRYEKEMLNSQQFISTQSEWVRSWIKPYVGKDTHLFNTGITVRNEFREAPKWAYQDKEERVIFCIVADNKPYKGLDIVLKALNILNKDAGNVSLRIAGDFRVNSRSLLQSGYYKMLKKFARKNSLESKISYLGSLNADELATELKNADVFVQPSFVESYSLALAEAMTIGTPCVVSYAGAMPELAIDNYSALFYNSFDYHSCAAKISKLINDRHVSAELSANSLTVSFNRNSPERVGMIQVKIYNKILNSISD